MHFTDVWKVPIYFERLVSKAVNYSPFCIFVLKGGHCKWIPLSTACRLCHPAEKWKGQFQFCEARIIINNNEINIKASNWVCSRCRQITITNFKQCMTILNREYQSHSWSVVITATWCLEYGVAPADKCSAWNVLTSRCAGANNSLLFSTVLCTFTLHFCYVTFFTSVKSFFPIKVDFSQLVKTFSLWNIQQVHY